MAIKKLKDFLNNDYYVEGSDNEYDDCWHNSNYYYERLIALVNGRAKNEDDIC